MSTLDITNIRTHKTISYGKIKKYKRVSKYYLVSQNDGLIFPLFQGITVLGRDKKCDIPLDDVDHHISRRHCYFKIVGHYIQLIDPGSFNGSRLNGFGVIDSQVKHGDIIQIAHHIFTLVDSSLVATSL